MNTIAVSNVVQTIFLQKIGKGRRFDSVYPAPVRIDERDIGQASRYDFCLCAVPGFRQFRPHDAQKFDVFFRPLSTRGSSSISAKDRAVFIFSLGRMARSPL